MTNMCNAHTFSVCCLDMIMSMIGLLHRELVKIIGEMIRSRRVNIPARINSTATSRSSREGSHLTLHVTAVVPGTKEGAVKPLEAAGCHMANFGADLTGRARSASTLLIRMTLAGGRWWSIVGWLG